MIRRANGSRFRETLAEAERFHMGVGKVQDALRALAEDLRTAEVDYAIIGAMALNAHGYRRETVDLDVLVRPEGLERFRDQLVGRGYVPSFTGARKSFKHTISGVPVEFVTTGEYPGDGKSKPVAFPNPSDVCVDMDGIFVVDLPTLINLKLASGMTLASRRRDLADVQDLIRILGLTADFVNKLHPFVETMYLTLVQELEEVDPRATE